MSESARVRPCALARLWPFSKETGGQAAALPDTNRRAAFHPTDPRLLAARSKDKKTIYLLELGMK